MATNPSKQQAILNPAMYRGSRINDPSFTLSTGYSPFDLSHQEIFTARFGEYTPYCHIDTIPADRVVLSSNLKTIHNRIDGHLLSTVNQYDETFFVSLANLLPNAYERFIPNPTTGEDLPNSALPQIPIGLFIANLLTSNNQIHILGRFGEDSDIVEIYDYHNDILRNISNTVSDDEERARFAYVVSQYSLIAFILSRGQLLDMLGFQPDVNQESIRGLVKSFKSRWQIIIDNYFTSLFELLRVSRAKVDTIPFGFRNNDTSHYVSLNSNEIKFDVDGTFVDEVYNYREWLYDAFEHGKLPWVSMPDIEESKELGTFMDSLAELSVMLRNFVDSFINGGTEPIVPTINDINSSAEPFAKGYINPLKILGYQLCIAQYGTNDYVDNIYTADLYMQNLRSVMFPAINDLSQEPIYSYNGVEFEYDLMTFGAWRRSFFDLTFEGGLARSWLVATLLFVMRRSLKYGDYFATARPRMLAVGDLYVNVIDGKVSPIDMTQNTLMQRYLNSANYLGRRIDSLYAGVYGVVPSDRPVCPRYVSHRKTVLQSQLTNNTAEKQGEQTTNLVGYADGSTMGVDVFLDDYGVLISIVSYDVLPVYTSGIDRTFEFSDRFDYFNPQLQNIGDQPIKQSELYGNFEVQNRVFGYQMRNAELKFKVSRCHGGCVNDLMGYVFRYPIETMSYENIGPDFIRDKPMYFDQLAQRMSGLSPAEYYHFIVAAVNEVKTARKMQPTPPILL